MKECASFAFAYLHTVKSTHGCYSPCNRKRETAIQIFEYKHNVNILDKKGADALYAYG